MSTARDPCPNCQLPFYTDRNEDCPYCASAAEHGSAGEDDPAASDHPDADGTGSEPGPTTVDTTPAGSVRRERPPSRPRTTCSQCGLDHYADDDSGCPYCSAAEVHGSEESPGTAEPSAGNEPEPVQPTAGSGESDRPKTRQSGSSGGLLSRIMGIFGR